MSDRLPHGYTNATSTDGRQVVKRYLGPDTTARLTREVAALRGLSEVLPVPPVREEHADRIVLGWVAGTPGQELLEVDPRRVLTEVGRTARTLHGLDPTLVRELGPAPSGAVIVHGDFGPQNLLLDAKTYAVTAVLDWELVRLGRPVEDLAWIEWIVRTHHPNLTGELSALFAGYGSAPAWSDRHAAMLSGCHRALDFVTRWSGPESDGVQLWQCRIEATERFADLTA